MNEYFSPILSLLAFRIDDGVWLHKQTSPLVLQFEQKTVGVSLEVCCSGLYKEAIFDLLLEYDQVEVDRLTKLAECADRVRRNSEIIRLLGRFYDVIFLQGFYQKRIILLKTVQIRPEFNAIRK